MTPFALFLVIVAACCHATWNLFVKRVGGGPDLVWLFSTVSVVVYFPLALAIVIIQQPTIETKECVFVIVSSLLHMAYFLLLQLGYRKGDLSLVYPTARATGPFLSTAFAVALLGEQLTPQIIAGALAIIVGVQFLTGGMRGNVVQLPSSLFFGVAAGVLIGSYTVWDAYIVSVLLVPPLLLDYVSSLGRMVLLSPYVVTRQKAIKEHWRGNKKSVIWIAILNPLAYILILVALTTTPVVYVAPARELSVLIGVMMGTFLLGEGEVKPRMLWATLILVGMVFLATG